MDTECKKSPEDVQTSRCGRCVNGMIRAVKMFVNLMISPLGSTTLLVAYIIVGGCMFAALEANHAKKIGHVVIIDRLKHVERIWEYTQELNVMYKSNWSSHVDQVLGHFQDSVYRAVRAGWDGQDDTRAQLINDGWGFTGSLLYSVSVTTTIGYGHLTPRTVWGRVVTIIYAVIGIPLTLLCLSNIGSLLANLLRSLCKRLHCAKPVNEQSGLNGQELMESPNQQNNDAVNYHGDDQGRNKDSSKMKESIRVPIVIGICLIVLYAVFGVILFAFWENWSFLDAFYFCFVTLSTIGFGDLVPGYAHESWNNESKRIVCSIYVLFGMVVLFMCFDLMAAELTAIRRKLARCLGRMDV